MTCHHRPWLGAAVLLPVLTLGACASSGADDARSPVTPASSDTEPGASEPAEPGATAPVDPAADPNSPFVVAASAVATRSRDQVVQLHAMAVATTTGGGNALPAEQIPALGRAIRAELGAQIEAGTMLVPPPGSPATTLVDALGDYRALAARLAAWRASDGPLADDFFTRLERTDARWRSALAELGELAERDLLEGLAPLPMPVGA